MYTFGLKGGVLRLLIKCGKMALVNEHHDFPLMEDFKTPPSPH